MDEAKIHETVSQYMKKIEELTNKAGELFGFDVIRLSEQTTDTNKQETLRSLWYSLQSFQSESEKYPSTQMLMLPAMDRYLDKLPRLWVLTLAQLQDKAQAYLQELKSIQELQADIRSNSLYESWKKTSATILSFTEAAGLPVTAEDVEDLPSLSKLLLNAASITQKWRRMRCYRGQDAAEKPVFIWEMPRFRDPVSFATSLRDFAPPCCIAIGMIEPLVRDFIDPAYDVKDWHQSELVHNCLKRKASELDEVWNGYAAFGIKRGGNVWILKEPIPFDRNPYGRSSFINFFGERDTYMPYQVTFKTKAETPGLVLWQKQAWNLRGILEKKQFIWLTLAISEIQKEFFSKEIPDDKSTYANSSNICLLPDGEKTDLVPYLVCHRPTGFEAQKSTLAEEVLRELHIDEHTLDGTDLRLPPVDFCPTEEYQAGVNRKARTLLAREAQLRLHQLFRDEECIYRVDGWINDPDENFDESAMSYYGILFYINRPHNPLTLTKKVLDAYLHRHDDIIAMLNDPDSPIHGFTGISISGRDSLSAYDTYRYSPDSILRCYPETLAGKRPQVIVNIRPRHPQEVALLLGLPVEQLDWRLRFRGHQEDGNDPVLRIANPYNQLTLGITICMNKGPFHKMFPYLYYTNKEK